MSGSLFLPFHLLAGCFAAAVARWERLGSGVSPRPRSPPALQCNAEAGVRARELLLRVLRPDQRAHYEAQGSFMVEVQGRGTFCILPRTSFNVVHLSSGDAYCCVCDTPVPLPDLMLAQKLMLELEPERFFSTANRIAGCDLLSPGLDFSARMLGAVGGDCRQPRVRCSMLSMIPHVGYLL